MVHLLIRQQVKDFETWKAAYDAHASARQNAGLREVRLIRGLRNPNEVILLYATEDLRKAEDFVQTNGLDAAIQQAGAIHRPEIFYLR